MYSIESVYKYDRNYDCILYSERDIMLMKENIDYSISIVYATREHFKKQSRILPYVLHQSKLKTQNKHLL